MKKLMSFSGIKVRGKQKTYEFAPYPLATEFNNIGGIYIFIKPEQISVECIYGGISDDMSRPVDLTPEVKLFKPTHIGLLHENNPVRRYEIHEDITLTGDVLCYEVIE